MLNIELSPGPRCVSLGACSKPNPSSASPNSSDAQGTAVFCDVDFSMHLLGVWKSLFCRVVWKQSTFLFFWPGSSHTATVPCHTKPSCSRFPGGLVPTFYFIEPNFSSTQRGGLAWLWNLKMLDESLTWTWEEVSASEWSQPGWSAKWHLILHSISHFWMELLLWQMCFLILAALNMLGHVQKSYLLRWENQGLSLFSEAWIFAGPVLSPCGTDCLWFGR